MPEANDIRCTAEVVATLIGTGRYELGSEKSTQTGIEQQLRAHLPEVRREHRLAPGDVVDFFVDGVAVEVKLKRNQPASILRQLERYARHDAVQAIVLVTNRAMGLPPEINGKPAYYVSLGRAWL